ncbi:hypothetical protein GQ55_5G432400 [Panicum hallii var. hallii]|uniref:Uncharacterized protein n=1 Tax=Panicum hallii var. hallii TaxID=1504633 RepID=A0A2T7DPE4_9POAL|nr:hypothetical protein GQ55_5G432400 [Panicum hallii var. hallii]
MNKRVSSSTRGWMNKMRTNIIEVTGYQPQGLICPSFSILTMMNHHGFNLQVFSTKQKRCCQPFYNFLS